MTIPRVDTHIHATSYRADRPSKEVTVAACFERCLEENIASVGILEHLGGWRHPIACLHDLKAEFLQLEPGIPVALGMEVNIHGPDGTMDGTEADRNELGLDFVLAESSSTPADLSSVQDLVEFDHKCQMAATQTSWVDVIVHPWSIVQKRLDSAGLEETWHFSDVPFIYLEEWADALADCNTACEINTKNIKFFEDPLYIEFIGILVKRGARIAIGSDAHKLERIGSTEPIYQFLEAQGFPAELIWFPHL